MAENITNTGNPAGRVFAITKSNSVDTEFVTRGIILGDGDGTLSIIDLRGVTTNLTGLLTGVTYAIRATRVRSSGTGATAIFGLA